jgi:putative thiamine transport system ATP-binding protein
MAMSTLHLQQIAIAIGGRHLVRDLSAEIAPGDCLSVMGPSGCGKSSLLAFVSGTLGPAFAARGRIALGDRVLDAEPPERRRLGILFQDDLLFPHLSIGGNLAFALPAAIKGREARRQRIDAALRDAGLEGFSGRDPATLSGGQRARVALLRTLLAEPRALLLDEPFAKLDMALREEFRRLVFAHARTRGLPTILVTHDEADAHAAGGAVLRLDPGAQR